MGAVSRRDCAVLLAGWLTGTRVSAAASDLFGSSFEDMRLVDQDGHRFLFDQHMGQVLLVNFVYTGCASVCPLQTRALADVLAGLPPDVRNGVHFISVSLDPLSDTPAALKAYAKRMGADLRQWSFVRGTPVDIARLAKRLRLFRQGKDVRQPDDHATSLWLVDARGRLMQRLHGNPVDSHRLQSELIALRGLAPALRLPH